MMLQPAESSRFNLRDRIAVATALVYPTAFTWLYFVVLADAAAGLQQSVYCLGKLLQFGFPAVWVAFVCREKLAWPSRPWSGVSLAVAFGSVIVAAMIGLQMAWLQPNGLLDAPAEAVRQRVLAAGIDSPARYATLTLFYSVIHSFLEEYYWRRFVFARLNRMIRVWPAIVVSSLGFMAHHVVVLSLYFGWTSFMSWFLSLCVAVGGVVWGWIYHRSGSLIASWLSHLLVDAGIFWIGYQMLKSIW